MTVYNELPDWAVPGPAPPETVKLKDQQRIVGQHGVRLDNLQPGSITLPLLDPAAILALTGGVGATNYGVVGTIGPNNDKQMYVVTNDGDGGTGHGLWQYESGAWVRAGASTRHASTHQPGGSDAMAVDAVAATGSLRTLGTGAQQAAAGADVRFPVTGVVTSDFTAISSNSTLADITGLGFTIGASATEIWRVTYRILWTSNGTTGDIKYGFTVPASCTMRGGGQEGGSTLAGWQQGGTGSTPAAISTGALSFGTAAVTSGNEFTFIVYGGGTGGTVQVRYAQNLSNADTLQILKGSSMEAIKLAA